MSADEPTAGESPGGVNAKPSDTPRVDEEPSDTPRVDDESSDTPRAEFETHSTAPPVSKSRTPTLGTAAVVTSRRSCSQCGALNDGDAVECANCGALAEDVGAIRAVDTGSVPRDRNSLQTYIIAGLALTVIALIVYILSTPEDKSGPPQQAAVPEAGAELPQGHPPVDQQAQTEALNKLVADLEARVAAQPDDDSLRLSLANALYDAGRHTDAKQHYAKFVAAHPNNLEAKTDFATTVAAAGNVDSAIVILNSIIAANEHHQRAAFNMAIMYRQKGNRDSIMYWLRRVAEIDSTTPPGKGALDIIRDFESGADHDHGGPGDTLH